MASERVEGDAITLLTRARARLGELSCDAPDLHHGDSAGVGERDRHLQDDSQLVPDLVGAAVVEGLRAIACLEEKGLPVRDVRERRGETSSLAGEHERREARQLRFDARQLVGIGPRRLLRR